MRELFSSYMEANEDWLSSSIVLTSTQSQNETTAGKFGWLSKRVPILLEYEVMFMFDLTCVFCLG